MHVQVLKVFRLRRRKLFSALRHRELAAGSPNDFACRTLFHELEAIADGVSLAHHPSQGNFSAQYGRYPRFADVDGVPSNHRRVARVDADFNFELEPWVAAQ